MKLERSPLIIWTFRRSGGTNLGKSLFSNLEFIASEHEPFNPDRIWGNVTKEWRENNDIEILNKRVESILKRKPLIKHCLEIIPSDINDVLLKLSFKHGYNHLFLYRECARSRLLSLNYSLKTNVWGRGHIIERPVNKEVFNQKIPIKELIDHEKRSRREMRRLYLRLIDLGGKPLSISFEQLYKSDFNYSSKLLKRLFSKIIGNNDNITEGFLENTIKGGGQGTNSNYLCFPNSLDFIKQLENLPKFSLHSDNVVECHFENDLDVKHFELWSCLPDIVNNQYFVRGVLLSDDDFLIESKCSDAELIKGLNSERVSVLYPKHPKSKTCRFIFGPVCKNEKIYFYKFKS